MIRYIKTFEVIFSTNNLSGMHISTMLHSSNVLKCFCPLSVYIYTIKTQLKYSRLRLIGTPVNRDNRLIGTTPKNNIFSIEANTKNFGYSVQTPLNRDKLNKLGSNFVLAQ